MTNLVRWDPFTELRSTMDRLFDEGFSRPWRFLGTEGELGAFPVEVSETDNEVHVKAALPGVNPDEVEISVVNDILSIKAEHREEAEHDGKKGYFRREIRYGSYHRSLSLPTSVDVEKAEAKFKNGMLYLTLPKAEAARPKQIKVRAESPAIESGR